jgi:hypothetical protein
MRALGTDAARTATVGTVLSLAGVLAVACGQPADDAAAGPAVSSPCQARFANGEFASNYAIVLTLSHPPAVDETATLTVGVCAKTTRAVVSVRLPDGVQWREPPAGSTVTVRPGPYGGCEQTATGQWGLSVMTPLNLVGTVAATKTGLAELAGSIDPVAGDALPGNTASVFVTVGTDRTSSHFGYPESAGDASATSAIPPVPVCG